MPNRMEEIASKAMGKTKAAKARMKGLKGIFKTLAEEHGEVSVLLKRVAKSDDPDVRTKLFPTIKKELLAHERGEVSVLYPLLREYSETRGMAQDHDDEATELEALIQALEQEGFDSPQWSTTFEDLVDLVEHHTSEEENEYFPRAQDVLGDKRAEELEDRYLAKKKSIMQQL